MIRKKKKCVRAFANLMLHFLRTCYHAFHLFFVMLIHANFLHRNQKILLLQLISDYSNFLKNLDYHRTSTTTNCMTWFHVKKLPSSWNKNKIPQRNRKYGSKRNSATRAKKIHKITLWSRITFHFIGLLRYEVYP